MLESSFLPATQSTKPDADGAQIKCSWCDHTSSTTSGLIYHTRLEHKMFNCDKCTFVGNRPTDLEVHMTDFHNSMLCIYCGITSGNVRALRKHYSVDHGNKLKKCLQCSFVTANKTLLTHHVNREHHRRKPRACPYCDYVAYADNRLKQHVLAIHEKQTPFRCPQCPLRFARKAQVKEHLKRRHQLDMPAELSNCPELGYNLPKTMVGETMVTEGTM